MEPEIRTEALGGSGQLISNFHGGSRILFFWLLGFVVLDIESIPGPDSHEIERKHVSAELLAEKERVEKKIAGLERDVENKRSQQRETADKSQNLQTTIGQLLELRRLSIEKETTLSQEEKDDISTSLKSFLESQQEYQRLNQEIAVLSAERQAASEELRRLEQEITERRKPAGEEYHALAESHRLRLAFYQLAILLPLLLLFGYLLVSRRGGIYYPLLLGVGGATLLKAALVVHEYFPSRYFKYVLIAALLAVVARLLIYLIRSVAFPKREWLARQYRGGDLRAVSLSDLRVSDSHGAAEVFILDAADGPQNSSARRPDRGGGAVHLSRVRHGGFRAVRRLRQGSPFAFTPL